MSRIFRPQLNIKLQLESCCIEIIMKPNSFWIIIEGKLYNHEINYNNQY